MFKKIILAVATFIVTAAASVAFAAVDVNKATKAELESLKGVGPVIADRILDERKKGAFKDWADLDTRVKGIGEGISAKISAGGATVGGKSFDGAPAKADAPAAKKDDKPAAKADAKDAKPMAAAAATTAAATTAKPVAAAASAAKPDAKQEKADKAAAAKKEKEEKAAAAKKAKAEKAAADKKAKEDKAMAAKKAKEDKAAAAASKDAKPAAAAASKDAKPAAAAASGAKPGDKKDGK